MFLHGWLSEHTNIMQMTVPLVSMNIYMHQTVQTSLFHCGGCDQTERREPSAVLQTQCVSLYYCFIYLLNLLHIKDKNKEKVLCTKWAARWIQNGIKTCKLRRLCSRNKLKSKTQCGAQRITICILPPVANINTEAVGNDRNIISDLDKLWFLGVCGCWGRIGAMWEKWD